MDPLTRFVQDPLIKTTQVYRGLGNRNAPQTTADRTRYGDPALRATIIAKQLPHTRSTVHYYKIYMAPHACVVHPPPYAPLFLLAPLISGPHFFQLIPTTPISLLTSLSSLLPSTLCSVPRPKNLHICCGIPTVLKL